MQNRSFSLLLSLTVAAAGLAGCNSHWTTFSSRTSWSIDGVELNEEREIEFELDQIAGQDLSLELSLGNTSVRAGQFNRGRFTVREYSPGDARIELRNGKLTLETESGKPAVFTAADITISSPLNSLELNSGSGAIEVGGIRVQQKLDLSTGMGSLDLHAGVEAGQVRLSSGSGEIQVHGLVCDELNASTGMGSLTVRDCESKASELESGLGDVDLFDSNLGDLAVSTGMGSIELRHVRTSTKSLETGMGKIREN